MSSRSSSSSRDRTWRVGSAEGSTVAAIVRQAGGDDRAIGEGRVFVGKQRALKGDDPVREGDLVRVAPPIDDAFAPAITLLAVEKDWVVANKPAGMPTIADHHGASHSLLARVAMAVGIDAETLHPTSRLDRDVSGIVVFTTTKQAAHRLASARETGSYVRRYVAIATGLIALETGVWDVPIGRHKDPRWRMPNGKDAVAARTIYARIATAQGHTLLALSPATGRTHQLRVHAQHAGAPLLGDRVYGGATRITLSSGEVIPLRRIALHAGSISVPSSSGEIVTFRAAVPDDIQSLWQALGGHPAAWDQALSL